MIVVATQAEASSRRRHYTSPHGAQAVVDTYIGSNKAVAEPASAAPASAASAAPGQSSLSANDSTAQRAAELAPNAYLVAQGAGGELHPHYHQADQFQVFVAGSGRIGTHAVSAVTVHYAAAHSPYGPLVAGPEGLSYLTLRRRWDPGAQWMPEHATRLRTMAHRRHLVATSDSVPSTTALPARGESNVMELLRDGTMGAWLVALGPDAECALAGSGDRFVYVLQGTLRVFDEDVQAHGCLFAGADEGQARFETDHEGARAVVVRFDEDGDHGKHIA